MEKFRSTTAPISPPSLRYSPNPSFQSHHRLPSVDTINPHFSWDFLFLTNATVLDCLFSAKVLHITFNSCPQQYLLSMLDIWQQFAECQRSFHFLFEFITSNPVPLIMMLSY